MPRDASGTYTLPIAPFQPLTLAKSADVNAALDDIADALTDSQSRAAPTPAQGDLNLNGHNILNLGGGLTIPGSASVGGGLTVSPDLHVTGIATIDGAASVASLSTGGTVSAGAVTAGSLTSSGNASVTGTLTAGYLSSSGNANVAGNLTASGTVSAGTVSAAGNVSASGSVIGAYVTSTGDVHAAGTLTGGALNVGGGAITAGNVNASGNVSCQGVYVSGGLFQIAPNYYLNRSGGDGAWRFVENGTANLTLDTSGNLTVRGGLYAAGANISGALIAPRLTGGEGGAGALQCYGSSSAVTFNWTSRPNNWLSYRMDGAVEYVICTAVNAQALQYFSGTGGPTTVGLAGTDMTGNPYYIYVDWVSDARIKHSIAPSQIDALALLEQVEVVEFRVRADAVAAIQPVSPEQKAALREAPDPFVPIGLVAQQVRPFLPEMVTIQPQHDPALPGDLHGLNTQAGFPYLVRAVQQLSARVAALEAAAGH
jgi:cytoskeletal protein CcmA (bactofilin family)